MRTFEYFQGFEVTAKQGLTLALNSKDPISICLFLYCQRERNFRNSFILHCWKLCLGIEVEK